MKTATLLFVLAAAVIVGGILWLKKSAEPAAPRAENKEEEAGPKVTRDARGHAVITLSDEVQGNMGLQVTNPAPAQLSPELKAFGRVLDPAPLAAAITEIAGAQAAYAASSNELARLKTLSSQGNASERALQAADAAALRDQLALQAAKDHLRLAWGRKVAEQKDLPAFLQSLIAQELVLVRIDLPAGEPAISPGDARLSLVSGQTGRAEFFDVAPSVDPQLQGRGFIYRVQPNTGRLAPGQSVEAYLQIPGEPLTGAVVPREAVVRTEGAGWVYVLDSSSGENFTRTEIPLDRPTEGGWFVTQGVGATNHVVVEGAQLLLSLERKGQGGE